MYESQRLCAELNAGQITILSSEKSTFMFNPRDGLRASNHQSANISNLKVPNTKKSFTNTLEARLESTMLNLNNVEAAWSTLRDTVYKTAMECLGPIFIDDEVNAHLAKASVAFGRLTKSIWTRQTITIETKIKVYNAAVLTTPLYGCKTWTACTVQMPCKDEAKSLPYHQP